MPRTLQAIAAGIGYAFHQASVEDARPTLIVAHMVHWAKRRMLKEIA
jgi:hypothetical protein